MTGMKFEYAWVPPYTGFNQDIAMNKITLSLSSIIFTFSLYACNAPEHPTENAADVAKAQRNRTENVAEAQREAQEKTSQMTQKNQKEQAKADYDVALTKAEGDRKVAREKCDALSGDAKDACQAQTDVTYDQTVTNAKAKLDSVNNIPNR